MIVKGPKQDLHIVVGGNLVAIRERRVHRAVRLEGPNTEMQSGRRIPDEHLRGIGRGNAIVRRELRESREHVRLLPHRLVEHPIDGHFGREAGDANVQLILATDVGRGEHHHGEPHHQEQGREHSECRSGQNMIAPLADARRRVHRLGKWSK